MVLSGNGHIYPTSIRRNMCISGVTLADKAIYDSIYMFVTSRGVRPQLTFLFIIYTNVGRIKLRYVNLNNSYDVT